MLGRLQRTTRTDVGLTLAFAGIAFLVWEAALAALRMLVNQVAAAQHVSDSVGGPSAVSALPIIGRGLYWSLLYAAPLWDALGLVLMAVALGLLAGASRQRWSVSWAWLAAVCQSIAAALLVVLGVVTLAPFGLWQGTVEGAPTTGWTALPLAVALGLMIWVTCLVWLLLERAKLRRGPSLQDGLRTHT